MPCTTQRKPKDKAEFDRFKTYLKLVGRQRPKPSRSIQPGESEMIVLEPTAEFLYDQCMRGSLKPEQITPETIEELDAVTKQEIGTEGRVLCVVKEATISFHGNSEDSIEISKDAPSSSEEPMSHMEKTLNLPSEQDFRDFQRYKALLAAKRPKSGRKMPSKMDFERFLAFKRKHGMGCDEPLDDTDMEQACEFVESPTRVFSAHPYQKKNILHDGLWSECSDAEHAASRARSPISTKSIQTDRQPIGSLGVWCFLGGVAAVILVNYMIRDDRPKIYYYQGPPPSLLKK